MLTRLSTAIASSPGNSGNATRMNSLEKSPGIRSIGWLGLVLTLQLLNLGCSSLWPGTASDVVATLLFMYALCRIFASSPEAVGMFAPYLLLAIAMILSLDIIGTGAYLQELAIAARPSPASPSYIAYATLFLLISLSTFERLSRRYRPVASGAPVPQILVALFSVLSALFLGYLLAAGSRTGFPLLTGIDRLKYRHFIADPITDDLLNLKPLIAVGLGVCAVQASTRFWRAFYSLQFASYIAVSMLYADKFFILLSALLFFLMPFLINDPRAAAKNVTKAAPFALMVLLLGCLVTFYVYSEHGKLSADDTFDKMFARASGQGQLWYVATRDQSHAASFDTKIVSDNVRSLFATKPADYIFEHRLAAFFFVERYSPATIYASLLRNGGSVTPTMVFDAYGLVAFGYLGLIVVEVTAAVFTAVVVTFLWVSIRTGNPFRALLPAFLMTQVYYVLTQATFNSVVSLSALKAYAALFTLQLIITALARGMRPGWMPPPT
jgi:hypothetical protein